ncbi:MAG: polysaccharide pyruvyl transferase CsaB [Fimbriimonas sp.]|nr:polysaccharide pyruvyl transferase CsaB [Fimbriimonas sp.]
MAAHLLLAGYIGCGNIGDDAIALGLVHGLGNAGYDITVMTGRPEETNRLYGFSVVDRRDFKAIEMQMEQCDALVFPGGSIFQDVTSVKSVAYYSKLIGMAKKAKKKVLLLAQGVGPLDSFFGKRMAASAFNDADVISVRDPESIQTLKSLGVRKTPRLTADSAFLLPPVQASDEGQGFTVAGMKSVGISVRPLDRKIDVASIFGDFCRLLYQSGSMPVLIEMDREEDGPLIAEISKRQGGKIPDLRKLTTPMQLQQRMSRMDSIVGTRLHAGILAATVGIPPLMVNYDPKVAAFSKMMELGTPLAVQGLTAQRLMDTFTSFQRDRERNGRIVERKREEMRKLAQLNVELIFDAVRA